MTTGAPTHTAKDNAPSPTSEPPSVDPQRVTYRLADAALVAAVCGLMGLIPLPSPVRAVLVAAFVFVGPGAAITTWVHLPRRLLPAAAVTLSMSATTIVAIGAMWSYRWNPTGILVVGALAVAASSIY